MPTTTSSTASLAERAVLAVRELIHDGGLLPGQPIRQLALAEQLGMSRVPLREALKNLQADGLVTASPTGGFEVTRLSADELGQFYLMRRLLESELLRRVEAVPESELELLAGLNARMAEMVDQPSRELRSLNREFHFRIFGLAAGLGHVVAEVSRLWDRTVALPRRLQLGALGPRPDRRGARRARRRARRPGRRAAGRGRWTATGRQRARRGPCAHPARAPSSVSAHVDARHTHAGAVPDVITGTSSLERHHCAR